MHPIVRRGCLVPEVAVVEDDFVGHENCELVGQQDCDYLIACFLLQRIVLEANLAVLPPVPTRTVPHFESMLNFCVEPPLLAAAPLLAATAFALAIAPTTVRFVVVRNDDVAELGPFHNRLEATSQDRETYFKK